MPVQQRTKKSLVGECDFKRGDHTLKSPSGRVIPPMAPRKAAAEKELTGEELAAQQAHEKLLRKAIAKGVREESRPATCSSSCNSAHPLHCCLLHPQVISTQVVQTTEQLPLCKGTGMLESKALQWNICCGL